MFTKVCGLSNKEQIDKAVELGYDAIGVVTYKKSKRYCQTDKAIALAEYAKNRINTFVVGISHDDVKDAAGAFDFIQIYEEIQLPDLALSSNKKPPAHLNYAYFIYDASTGSGVFRKFPEWLKDFDGKLVVAGGLTPENVGSVIKEFRPYGVDVSSGVELNGVKDFKLMKRFIEAVKKGVTDI